VVAGVSDYVSVFNAGDRGGRPEPEPDAPWDINRTLRAMRRHAEYESAERQTDLQLALGRVLDRVINDFKANRP
jgi:hypothetical protein